MKNIKKMKKFRFANSILGGGHIKTNSAFTLIELLAIIVILAIIAVITVPIILNVIDNSKKGAAKDSAYGYKDAINKYYVTKLAEDTNFKINDGTYTVSDLKTMGVTVSGNEPSDGWVKLEKNQIVDYSLKFDEYVVDYDNNTKEITVTKNGMLKTKPASIITVVDGVKYYDSAWINANPVYYDPTGVDTDCTVEDYNNNNDKLGKIGCMKWFAYSENADGTVNMILDHNTTPKIDWVTSEHYGTGISPLATSLGITYPNGITGNDSYGTYGNWNKGPITLLNQLKIDTDSWSDELIRNDSYTDMNSYNNNEIVIDRYIIDYNGYKARIITNQEIFNIVEEDVEYSERFDSTSYAWLLSNTEPPLEIFDLPFGYWTTKSCTYTNDAANFVAYGGVFSNSKLNNNTITVGLRPVITISKSVIEN